MKSVNTRETIGLGNPMTSSAWSMPPLHIPNTKGEVYKTELVVERTDDRVVKINWWHAPDDDDIRARPHNHPWRFTSEVLHGELTEIRYTPVYRVVMGEQTDEVEGYRAETITHRAGETYVAEADTYHVVISVAPGTVTRMTCERVVNNPWGYLDIYGAQREDGLTLGTHVPAEKDPSFLERMWTFNPFKRPKK